MSFQISGKSGKVMEVSDGGRALVNASSLPYEAEVSWKDSETYWTSTAQIEYPARVDLNSGDYPIPFDNAGGLACQGIPSHYFKNTSKTKSLVVERVFWSCDGGKSPTAARIGALQWLCQFTVANAAPTGGIAASFATAPKRLNFGAGSLPPDMDVAIWDGDYAANDGLIMPPGSVDGNVLFTQWRVGKGQDTFFWKGSVVLPPGSPGILHVFNVDELVTTETINFNFDLILYQIDIQADAQVI